MPSESNKKGYYLIFPGATSDPKLVQEMSSWSIGPKCPGMKVRRKIGGRCFRELNTDIEVVKDNNHCTLFVGKR